MRRYSQAGFIARGGCAVLIFAILTVAYVVDVIRATPEDPAPHAQYWTLVLVAAVFTAAAAAWRRANSRTCSECGGRIPSNYADCPHCASRRRSEAASSLSNTPLE
jgi:hypothetical protein